MSDLRNSDGSRSPAPTRVREVNPKIDRFGAWVSFLVVFAAVMAGAVVWQNFNDHAYSIVSNTQPHTIVSTLAQK